MVADNLPQMTEAEYLAFDDEQEFKFEYRQGQVIDMTGISVWNAAITANIATQINTQLRDTDYLINMSRTRVYIESYQAYRFPDVLVFGADFSFLGSRDDTIIDPVMLVEVTSPQTALTDCQEKLEEYIHIKSLQSYVLVDEKSSKVQVYRRYKAGQWLYQYVTGLDAEISVSLSDAELQLELAEIYRRVEFK